MVSSMTAFFFYLFTHVYRCILLECVAHAKCIKRTVTSNLLKTHDDKSMRYAKRKKTTNKSFLLLLSISRRISSTRIRKCVIIVTLSIVMQVIFCSFFVFVCFGCVRTFERTKRFEWILLLILSNNIVI